MIMAAKSEQPESAPSQNGSSHVGELEINSSTGAPEMADPASDALVKITVVFPQPNQEKIEITVSPQEQVHEVRQSIIDLPAAFRYTCFHLEYNGQKINDFITMADIPDLEPEPEFRLVQDPYNEKEARIHFVRIRELIGAAGNRADTSQGVLAGMSLFESVTEDAEAEAQAEPKTKDDSSSAGYDFGAAPSLTHLIPKEIKPAPKTIKSVALSAWNPPPCHLRQRGHLLYLVISTNEGEQHQVTSHVSGFFVSKSSNAKFDPFPKPGPKGYSAHSLLELLELMSPSFAASFVELQEYNNVKDPLATFQITNAIPSAPWAVPSPTSSLCTHLPDATRPQETYLLSGVDNTDTLRDWNEEFQSAKELPKDTVQDRVFRERLVSKLFADYNDAASRGAVMVARGEISPLNPTECRDAQIFVYNNIFFSFGADGVGTFTSEGGDEAARVATGKDVAGVKLVNQLDIDGLFTPATVVVDYLGKRMVAQTIVPGIFKQREPGENQIDYGAVDGKDVIAADERFTSVFSKLSQALKVKKHSVWDKDGKRFDLEASVETKGLMGTDGRKYALDLYRISPLDIAWLEEAGQTSDQSEAGAYPHRMTVLRPELVESLSRSKLREFIQAENEKLKAKSEEIEEEGGEREDKADAKDNIPKPDLSKFQFSLNPDAFSGQVPQTEEESAQWKADEDDVRAAGQYLRDTAIPNLLKELSDSDVSSPMDGQSLSSFLHKRGINMRYLGKIVSLCQEPKDGVEKRLQCLKTIAIQNMVARSFKHVTARYLRDLPVPLTAACIAHLLNCFLGHQFNPEPIADVDVSMKNLFPDIDLTFEKATPDSIRAEIEEQTLKRFRYQLEVDWFRHERPVQLLREVCLQMGIQVLAKDYTFVSTQVETTEATEKPSSKNKKKKKKAAEDTSDILSALTAPAATFSPDDIVHVVPVVKHSCPRSTLADEALEAGRVSLLQGEKKLGQELLLESLSLHEQIYGILHPEVARVYNALSMLYYNLDDKDAAVELAKKAIVVAERTVGVDSPETLLDYLNLSLFLHQHGRSKEALVYSKHALKLWKVIYGPDHPDSVTTLNNAAVMLQHVKEYHESRLWFEESLRVCETLFGKTSVNSATLLFQLAQALALDNESKASVSRMRESRDVFLNELGKENKNTQEAEHWLSQLTSNAVNIARNEKLADSRRLQSKVKFHKGATPEATSGGPKPITNMSDRTPEEIANAIMRNDSQTKPSKKKTSQGNPKRRGQAGSK